VALPFAPDWRWRREGRRLTRLDRPLPFLISLGYVVVAPELRGKTEKAWERGKHGL
jgi:hypothetical protein